MASSVMTNTSNVLLSSGSLQKILNGIDVDCATLQILGYKRVPGEGIERFRLLLNDGTSLFSFAILATQLNCLIKDRKLEKFSVLKLNKYVCTVAQPNKKIIICLDIAPLIPGSQINHQIEYLKTEENHKAGGYNDIESSSNNNQASMNKNQINHIANGSSNTSTSTLSSVTKALVNPTCSRYFNSTNNCNQSVDENCPTSAPTSLTSVFIKTEITPSSSEYLKSSDNCNQSVTESKNIAATASSTPVASEAASISTAGRSSNSTSDFLAGNSNWDRAGVPQSLSVASQKPVVPIISLTPYQNKWTIKACVIYKTHVSSYNNSKKSGKLFSFCLLDESGEIKATAFDRQAETLYEFLQLNGVYYISEANVRLARTDSSIHDFELTISDNTKIEPVPKHDSETPKLTFDFTAINQIVDANKNFVDVIGICVGVEFRNITVRATNKQIPKLDLQLMDIDQSKIIVTIWGNEAESCNFDDYPVIAVKRAKVTDFNGCSLNVSPSSMMFINPRITEAHSLKAWFNEHRSSLQLDLQANSFERNQVWKTVADINDLDISNPNVTDYSTVKATIVMVQKDNAMYQACPSTDCFKKVTQNLGGQYHCSKCNKDYDTYSWTLMLKINLADFSSGIWAVAFKETAETLLNLKTDELSALKEESEDKFQDTLSSLHFKSFIFKLRSKVEVFNDNNQLKITILDSKPIDTITYTKNLLFDIKRLDKILSTNK